MVPDAVARIAPEQANVRDAIVWSSGSSAAVAHELVGRLAAYWLFTGTGQEGVRLAEVVLRGDAGDDEAARFSGLVGLSELYTHTGDVSRGIELKERALVVLDELDDRPIPAASGNFTKDQAAVMVTKDLAQAYAQRGDLVVARGLADKALEHARAFEGDLYLAHAYYAKGMVEFWSQEFAAARRLFEESLPHSLNVSSDVDVAGVRLMIGECLRREGKVAAAIAHVRASLDLLVDTGDTSILHEVIQELAAVAAHTGRPETGGRLLGSSERLREEAGVPTWDPADRDRIVAFLRAALGEHSFEDVHLQGAGLSNDEVFALARSID